jgi:PIN domain nuclease of toxin-antitoxin system
VKILIDTGCWLWSLTDPERLNERARELLADSRQELFLSSASSWEIAIKAALGKLQLPQPPSRFVPARMAAFGIQGLPVEHTHALRVFALPLHHRDPFDRLLIAQAQIEKMAILTADHSFAPYDVKLIWAF